MDHRADGRMKTAVIQFPGSNCDRDAVHAFADTLSHPARLVWHKESSLGDAELVVLPGGFSFGDYLRCGAIARFSPIMRTVTEFAENGGVVLGICNGFQVLCEAGLLPGALIRNECLEFRCRNVPLQVENAGPFFNRERLGERLFIPVAHGEGNYLIDPEGLAELKRHEQILFRYLPRGAGDSLLANPNGSVDNIAGIRNRRGNVFGMMPHPERAVEGFHPSRDGISVLEAVLAAAAETGRGVGV